MTERERNRAEIAMERMEGRGEKAQPSVAVHGCFEGRGECLLIREPEKCL